MASVFIWERPDGRGLKSWRSTWISRSIMANVKWVQKHFPNITRFNRPECVLNHTLLDLGFRRILTQKALIDIPDQTHWDLYRHHDCFCTSRKPLEISPQWPCSTISCYWLIWTALSPDMNVLIYKKITWGLITTSNGVSTRSQYFVTVFCPKGQSFDNSINRH